MKESVYAKVLQTVESLTDGETDLISMMSTVSCELYHAFDDWNWVGFYRRVDSETLKVGPYQGSHGCLTINIARGVCGKCVREAEVQIENHVAALEHHIACSAETEAEIVLPVFDESGEVIAVLDIDSIKADVFDDVDVTYLKKIIKSISR